MPLRDHSPIVMDQLNGLYLLGDPDECPADHFQDGENFQFIGSRGISTRDGIAPHQEVSSPLANIVRLYNYITQDANTLLVLTEGGDVYHVLENGLTVFGPILSIPEMTDMGVQPYNGRAYITPFGTFNGIEKGLEDEVVYVYMGEGEPARPAAGLPPSNAPGDAFDANNGGVGNTDPGFHIFAVVYETDSGFLTALGPSGAFATLTTLANNEVDFTDIPVSPDDSVVARRIVATKIITRRLSVLLHSYR